MAAARTFIAALLILSLSISDAVTFWHASQCGCNHSHSGGQDSTVGIGSSHRADVCDHSSNPFAKRKSRLADATAARTCEHRGQSGDGSPATSDHCNKTHQSAGGCSDQHESPGQNSSPHDSERCTLCRWLVTARDSVGAQSISLTLESTQTPYDDFNDWQKPIDSLRAHDLSRRGPPAPPALS